MHANSVWPEVLRSSPHVECCHFGSNEWLKMKYRSQNKKLKKEEQNVG